MFRGAALEDHRLDPLQMQQLTEHQAGRAAAYDADLGAVWNGGFGHAVFRRDCILERSVTRTPNGDVSVGAGPHTDEAARFAPFWPPECFFFAAGCHQGVGPRRRRRGDGGVHPPDSVRRGPRSDPAAASRADSGPHDTRRHFRSAHRRRLRVAARVLVGRESGRGSLHRLRDAVEHSWPCPLALEEFSHGAMANAYDAGAANLPFAALRTHPGGLADVNPRYRR